MSESTPPEDKLAEEFHNLGKNLMDAFRTAWETPERQKLQQDIESGLNELGNTLRQEYNTFSESPTGQKLKADVEDLHERVRTGEAEAKVRSDLLVALKTVNEELQKVTDRLASHRPPEAASEAPSEQPPVESSPEPPQEA
jgi:hypothetical protein